MTSGRSAQALDTARVASQSEVLMPARRADCQAAAAQRSVSLVGSVHSFPEQNPGGRSPSLADTGFVCWDSTLKPFHGKALQQDVQPSLYPRIEGLLPVNLPLMRRHVQEGAKADGCRGRATRPPFIFLTTLLILLGNSASPYPTRVSRASIPAKSASHSGQKRAGFGSKARTFSSKAR